MTFRCVSIIWMVLIGILIFRLDAVAGQQRVVVGEVTAIDTQAKPQTLVVKTKTAKGKNLIVGCRLASDAVIKIGRRTATLEEIQVGDRVRLTYVRVKDGLVAKQIQKNKIEEVKQSAGEEEGL